MFGTSSNPTQTNIMEDAVDIDLPALDSKMLFNVDRFIFGLRESVCSLIERSVTKFLSWFSYLSVRR